MPYVKEIFWLEVPHIILTSIIVAYFYWRFRSWELAILCFVSGVLIDVDHLFDYFHYLGWQGLDLRKFFTEDIFDGSGTVFVPLHSWELLIPIWVWGFRTNRKKEAFALSSAFFGHLLIDYFSYSVPWPFYSLTYRLITSFANPCL